MTAFWFWIIVAIAFAVAEVMTVAFFAVFMTVGALAAALLSLLGIDLCVQALGMGVLGVFAARPCFAERQHIARRALRSGADSMVGQQALLLEPILGVGQPGHVKIAGESWPALTEDGSPLPATTPVIVTAIRSTVLIVRATSSPSMPSV